MRRPGGWLRKTAARFYSARTMERLIDPVLADLQVEYENAVHEGRKWERRSIWCASHIAFFKVVAVHAAGRVAGILRDLTGEDRRTLMRTFGCGTAVMLLGTVILAAVPFRNVVLRPDPSSAKLALYLIPQALPISIPVGLLFGILWGLGRVTASRRSRLLVLLVAATLSVTSFTMLAWIVPAANQAFRRQAAMIVGVSVVGRPPMKGMNELTLDELGNLLESDAHQPVALFRVPRDIRPLAVNYHTRWALACASFVLSLFSLALTSRRRHGSVMLGLAGCMAIFGYYVIMFTARDLGLDGTLPAVAAAWAPNAVFLILSVAVMKVGSRRSPTLSANLRSLPS